MKYCFSFKPVMNRKILTISLPRQSSSVVEGMLADSMLMGMPSEKLVLVEGMLANSMLMEMAK